MNDPGRADLARLPPDEWIARHAERLLGVSEAAAATTDRAGQAIDLAVACQRIVEGLRAALDGFKVSTGWPRPGLKATPRRWADSGLLASRAERCVIAFYQAAQDILSPPQPAAADPGQDPVIESRAVAEERLEEALGRFNETVTARLAAARAKAKSDPGVN